MTRTFGKRNMVISLSIRSTALHFSHLYPHFSIFSVAIKSSRQSYKLTEYECEGSERDRSMKLSNVKLSLLHFRHFVRPQSCPSNKSVIIESSRSRKYLYHTSDYFRKGYPSQSICLYFGFLRILFSSSCIPSNRNLKNSWASCYP